MKKWEESFKARLITLAVLPVVILALMVVVVVGMMVKNTLEDDMTKELKASAYSIRAMIADVAEGDFSVGEDGELYKGTENLTSLNSVFDKFYSDSGMYATVFFGDTRMVTSVKNNGTRAVGTQASPEVSSSVLAGNEYTSFKTLVAGTDSVVAYVPMYQSDGKTVCGMVFTGITRDRFVSKVNSAVINVVIVTLGVGIVTALVSIFISIKLDKAVSGVSAVVSDLADGYFTKEDATVGADRADAVGNLVRNVNDLKKRFGDAVSGVKDNVSELQEGAGSLRKTAKETADYVSELSRAVEDIANGATSQAQETDASAKSVTNIVETMKEIGDNVDNANKVTDVMATNSEKVVADFDNLIKDTLLAVTKLKDITGKMEVVKEAVDTVTVAAGDINNIASQTNLLSLNASIEAARAGEAGKGFAVVASEIQSLADESDKAAVQIRDIMSRLKDETEDAVRMVGEMSVMMEKQDETSRKSKESLNELIEDINKTKETVGEVDKSSKYVTKLCNSLNDSITSLSAVSEENAASTQETSASITQLTEITGSVKSMGDSVKAVAEKLDELTAYFKIG